MFRDGLVSDLREYYEKCTRFDQKSIDRWIEHDLEIFDFCKEVIDAVFENIGSTKTVRIARKYDCWSQKIVIDFNGSSADFDYTKKGIVTTGQYGSLALTEIRSSIHYLIFHIAIQHESFLDKWAQAYIEYRFNKKFASVDDFKLEMTE